MSVARAPLCLKLFAMEQKLTLHCTEQTGLTEDQCTFCSSFHFIFHYIQGSQTNEMLLYVTEILNRHTFKQSNEYQDP
jgi:hypothetical protein